MSKLNLRKNITKSEAKEEIKEDSEDLEFIEIPEYFREGKDLSYSATINGDTRTNTFFTRLTLAVIIFGIIFGFCYIIFGPSFIITIKAWIHQLTNIL